ncbi:MAG TPA: NAD(P)H-hydrate dehydratase, partial [Chitinophagales bacterium]|nr:NAD(P)H-hydrate dehydratase [Chitinophagales bacterium]
KTKDLIIFLNKTNCTKISIDIPTGLFADQANTEGDIIFKPDIVYTFQAPKLSFLLPENESFVREFKVLDIGLAKNYLKEVESKNTYIEQSDIKNQLLQRTKFTHKGTYGHSLIIAGSYGKTGAALLASKANLRAGSGMLTTHVPIKSVDVLQTYVPEAMSSIDIDEYCFSQLPDLQNKTIGIGPGLGTEKQTAAAFHQLLKSVDSPMVIDADAINILSKNKSWIDLIPKNSILTPHPKEFKRLVGKWNNDFERLETQRSFSISHQLIIILKGAHTSISDTDGQIYFNSTGNSGMATAGSGDVLTGIITALLAQNYSPIHTAIIGVFLHGLAGDLALTHQSKESLIASDIINNLGNAYKHLEQNE